MTTAIESIGERKVRIVRSGKLSPTEAIAQLRSAICGRALGREFGESVEAFYARRPDVAAEVASMRAAISELSAI